MKLTPLNQYQKAGFWLAVVSRRNKLFVAGVAREANKALARAKELGIEGASLMKSARNYGLWAPKNE